ncbi:MAG: c-type cytochrome [Phycisphaerae bacterium]|nr:c-type cytochrome [Phycisphaerae bacterium]
MSPIDARSPTVAPSPAYPASPSASAVATLSGGVPPEPAPTVGASRPARRYEGRAVAIAIGACVAALGLALGAAHLMRLAQVRLTPNPRAPLPLAALAPLPQLDMPTYVRGRALFVATCATCHGPAGTGVPGLGKDLTHSLFVFERRDSVLVDFIRKGRDAADPLNTTKVAMPPLGGNPDLTAADLGALVVFMRGLQDPRRVPDVPEVSAPVVVAVKEPTDKEKAEALEAAGGDAERAEWIASGRKLFVASCASCHGKDGLGMPGLGKDLTTSEFVHRLSDDDLLAFLLKGRDPSDPANTSKIAMPPKGGNPALSEDDLLDIIAFLRSVAKTPGDSRKPQP